MSLYASVWVSHLEGARHGVAEVVQLVDDLVGGVCDVGDQVFVSGAVFQVEVPVQGLTVVTW